MTKVFNAKQFGFNMSYSDKNCGGAARRGNYVMMDNDKKVMKLVMDIQTTERVRELFGERVAFGMDSKGRIAITGAEGTMGRKLSKAGSSSLKAMVSMGSMYEDYKSVMGTFKMAYVEASVYDGGSAIVFTPTGEFERV